MAATLAHWCAELAADDVTATGLARQIGEIVAGEGTPQLTVRPSDGAWAQAEIISRPGEDAPSLVRLVPAGSDALPSSTLDDAFGTALFPPKVNFTDPVTRFYELDTGAPSHTTAVIAELPPEGGDHVTAVTLRRDIRL